MNVKISDNEGKWLMISLLLPKIFFTPIYNIVTRSGTGAYLEVIYLAIIAFALTAILTKLYSGFNENNFYSTIHFACGKTCATIIGTIFFILSITNTIIMLRIFSSVISLLTLEGSSLIYIMAFIALTVFVSAQKNINGLSKISILWGVLISFIFISIILMCLPEIDLNNIFPILGNGAKNILTGYEDLPIFYEIVYFVFILPYINKNKSKTAYKSVLTFSVVLLIFTLLYTFLVPYPVSEKFKFPLLQITSSVNLDILFQRIEALYLIAVIFSSFIYLGTTFTISLNIAKSTYNITDCKALTGALLLITLTLSLMFKNTESVFLANKIFSKIFFILGFIIIIFILTLANIRKKFIKGENKK